MASHYKRPESVLVIIYTLSNDVLLLNRVQPSGYWQSVTGSLEWSESAIDTAKRELHEETGLVVNPEFDSPSTKAKNVVAPLVAHSLNCFPILPDWRARYAPEIEHNIEHVFSVCLKHIQSITLASEEHTEYQWLAKALAIEKASSYTNQKAIHDILPN